MKCGATHSPCAAHGFTLMEMLVTLVIFALVSGLLWQAMANMARIEQGMAGWTRGNRDAALREEWLRELLRGLTTGASGDTVRFHGDRQGLSGYSSMPPWPGTSGPMQVELRLQNDALAGTTSLLARDAQGGRTLELFTWPARVHFEYLDEAGTWHETWSPPPGDQVPLPRAVRLAGMPHGDLLVAVPAIINPMLRRVDLEQP